MLNDAIEAGEWETVIDIAVGAGHYGYIDIHDHGAAAYEAHKADGGGGG
jgi:hypothetical protein